MLQAAQPAEENKLHKLSKVTSVLKHSSDFPADSKDIGSVTQDMLL